MIALDSETTGLDLRHTARPFFVTICREDGSQLWWEWPVDPLTRAVQVPAGALDEVRAEVEAADELVLQNAKFDVAALRALDGDSGAVRDWPWGKTHDTLIAAHLLASNGRHDLTALARTYLGQNVQPCEDRLEQAVQEARRWCRSRLPAWQIAREGLPGMPSAKSGGQKREERSWKFDCWLPRALVQHWWETSEAGRAYGERCTRAAEPNIFRRLLAKDRVETLDGWEYRPPGVSAFGAGDGEKHHPYWTVLAEYANTDSAVTLAVWRRMRAELHERGLWQIYQSRRRLPEVAWAMEDWGVSMLKENARALRDEFEAESARAGAVCRNIAADHGYGLELPKAANNGSLLRFCFAEARAEHARKQAERAAKKEAVRLARERERAAAGVKVRRRKVPDRAGLLAAAVSSAGSGGGRPEDWCGWCETVHPGGPENCPDGGGQLPDGTAGNGDGDGNGGGAAVGAVRYLDLPVLARTDSGAPAFDKHTAAAYLDVLEPRTAAYAFIEALGGKRRNDTGLTYLDAYERFWLPLPVLHRHPVTGAEEHLWYRLHPSLSPTGTNTLRWSSSNPNSQNVSKQDDVGLRSVFGPAPGREWWSLDAKNIELRIPAYEAGEPEMIALFERPNDPPFFGSNHMLVFSILWPELWADALARFGPDKAAAWVKDEGYGATQYQWTKNGNFAVQYGAVDRDDGDGTADRAYHQHGAQAKIAARFERQAALNRQWIRFAEKHGHVETLPDRSVDPARGYPVLCARTDYGKIKPTVPLNYHVQGTACWWMGRAMVRVHDFFGHLNGGGLFKGRRWPGGYRLTLQVHDELVLDVPSGAGKGAEPWEYNRPVAREVKRLMERGGHDIGVPTPVSMKYHAAHWGQGRNIV